MQVDPTASSSNSGYSRLRYLQEKPIVVPGSISGRRYFFSGDRPLNSVDVRDVESLMKIGLFRLV